MKYSHLLVVLFLLSFSTDKPSIETDHSSDNLKINQIQVIASHNSYHLRTDAAVLRFLKALRGMGLLPADLDPKQIDYNNAPLTDQLEKYGVRGLELDVWNDPEGGRFYHRMGKQYVFKTTSSGTDALMQPGFKLLHIPDFDFRSTNNTFKEAIAEVKKWSDAHPDHTPVFINVETETSAPGDQIHFLKRLTRAAPFDSVAADELDLEVKSVFGEQLNGVITPDQVRGNYLTLEEAVLAGNWPTLGAARGKVIFIMDAGGNSATVYRKGHPSFKNRTMFVYAEPKTPEAAFVIMNEPDVFYTKIQQRVKQGYIVRTRSDEGTFEARSGDYKRMNCAFASCAQIISTDYYKPDARAVSKQWSNYHVQFAGGSMIRVDSISGAEPGTIHSKK
ncbi:MAG: hypothetical protein JWO06_1327 [Bacteroidota bacterium]|nr:hypothetical protein [Bacteroidota bacterium]